MSDKLSYSSYNGMSRVPMMYGVPLIAGVVIAMISLFVGFAGAFMFGIGGILFAGVGIPIFLYIKKISENDDQALRITFLELWCRLTRRGGRLYGNTYTLSPMQYGRRAHVYKRYFKTLIGK
ncbi:type IV secretion system protein VirB3 [Massilia eurypsychrophila]|uniref:Type IV secretion system protein VirB3 n=1 Tax=Massilia eurypsychrophila TaxID=1485217 RepID=A0A2G8T9C2_9BURK|nr:VirB3 family type IV secretion system protein [Massilia eurypsychrophila]PIL42645.1 type IV secretion system protein VirB3 [Massilia eurypsychrophila]